MELKKNEQARAQTEAKNGHKLVEREICWKRRRGAVKILLGLAA